MDRVAKLVNEGDYGQALVRLWVLAGRRANNNLALNQWEHARDVAAHSGQVGRVREALQKQESLTVAALAEAPLALVEALDREHALLHRNLPWSNTPIEEEGVSYWLVPVELARRHEVPLARQTGNREAWFKSHAVIPVRTTHGVEVMAFSAAGRLAEVMVGIANDKDVKLTCWIGHFEDNARLEWDISKAQCWRFRQIHPANVRSASIVDTLERAADARAHVVVLPELTVDLEARKLIADWLIQNPQHPFELVVAGSFHENTRDGWFNTSELWNRHGDPIFSHRKLRLYGQADGFAEDVQVGNRISVLVTGAGSWSLLICKDFLDEHQSVATLLQEVPVDWVLVPSYGDKTTVKCHADRALTLAKVGPGCCSIIANQRNVEVSAGEPCPGFAQLSSGGACAVVGVPGGLVSLAGNRIIDPAPSGGPPKRRIRIVK